ncbi:MAG: methylenetetrahydrofolate reductase C-terminal domain-containing protein [Halanaerobiaceae bacterium]
MIVGKLKEVNEIKDSLPADLESLLIVGCGSCVSVSLAGGEREVESLKNLLDFYYQTNNQEVSIETETVKRQCDDEFLDELELAISRNQIVLSLACGVGVQHLAIKYPDKIVLPGLDTTFYGRTSDIGEWEEMCHGCGKCILDQFAGVCPVARCSKSLLNGPCGGSQDGICEVDDSIECGWQKIYDRAEELGQLENLLNFESPKDWSTHKDGGVRSHKDPEFFQE